MLRFEWNALRPGDHVLVHDDANAGLALVDAEVVLVQAAPVENEIGVRMAHRGAASRLVRPRRLAVHLAPVDPTAHCWRCADIAATATRA